MSVSRIENTPSVAIFEELAAISIVGEGEGEESGRTIFW